MERALVLTAYDRVDYLREVLDSWRSVRGLQDWDFVASIEPSPVSGDICDLLTSFVQDMGIVRQRIIVQPRKLGVLEHPYVAMDGLFQLGHEFVVRVEDDLLVSDDFLEYMSWADDQYRNDPEVASILGFSSEESDDPTEVSSDHKFSPLNWGTWADRWSEYIGPTWDHDYSTYNGSPGINSGWDWNINTRVFPSLGKTCIRPSMSRVQNIGKTGTHATGDDDYIKSPSFRNHFGEVKYTEGR